MSQHCPARPPPQAFDAAEAHYRAALAMCEGVFGARSAEAGSPIYQLGACYRQAGRVADAIAQFDDLYAIILDTQVRVYVCV